MSLVAVPLTGVGNMVIYSKNETGSLVLTVEDRVFTPTEISKRLSGMFPVNCEQTPYLIKQIQDASSANVNEDQICAVEMCIEIAAIYPAPKNTKTTTRLTQAVSVFCECRFRKNAGVY